jgi:hypothetical protein
VQRNNPNYDDKKLTYGFLIALHTANYQVNYADQFVTQQFDTVHSVNPMWTSGFSLGFIVNYRLNEFLDLRLTPQVAFYEQKVRYQYTDETFTDASIENYYGGASTSPEVQVRTSRKYPNVYDRRCESQQLKPLAKKNKPKKRLELKGTNLSIEAGFGFDLYYSVVQIFTRNQILAWHY